MNEFVKRVRAAKIHVLIMGHLRKQMPSMMGKQKAQDKLLRDLPTHFAHVQREHHLPAGAPWACLPDASPWHGNHAPVYCREGNLQHGRRLHTEQAQHESAPARLSPAMALNKTSRHPALASGVARLAGSVATGKSGGRSVQVRPGAQA